MRVLYDQPVLNNGIGHLFVTINHQSFKFPVVFGSSEPEAQVSFSDQNLSVVCLRCLCRSCRRYLNFFTFSSSSPEPLGQFQPNLAQSILW